MSGNVKLHVETPAASNNSADAVKVGFFDSGVGGISVVREFRRLCPDAEVFYIADWEYCPYGNKTADVIIERSCFLTEKLIGYGCRLVVVACNTATAAAIDYLRKTYDIPFVGMEPAVKPAALRSKSGVVGIIATSGTFRGRLFKETSSRFSDSVKIITVVGEGFVELVENGDLSSDYAFGIVEKAVKPLVEQGVDHIVLGCTHYPFLRDLIAKAAGDNVVIVDSSEAVARRAASLINVS